MQKHTQNIDAIANTGVLFEHATSDAGSHLPGHLSLQAAVQYVLDSYQAANFYSLSSRRPSRVCFPQETKTLPEILKADPAYGKYKAGHFGTWHLGVGGPTGAGLPSHHGFDQFFGTPTPTSLAPCDNGKGWKDTMKTADKYGNPIGLQTEDTASAAKQEQDDTPLADDEEWIEEDDADSANGNLDAGPSRDYGLSFWAFWSLSSLLWQSILLSSFICWFANGLTTTQCAAVLLLLIALAAVPFSLLDNLSMSDPHSCMLDPKRQGC